MKKKPKPKKKKEERWYAGFDPGPEFGGPPCSACGSYMVYICDGLYMCSNEDCQKPEDDGTGR